MTYRKSIICAAALTALAGCQSYPDATPDQTVQNDADILSCIRTTKALELGRWAYMGTIAQVRGKFRTYEAVFVHEAPGPDMWSFKAFGGDVGGDEDSAVAHLSQLVGTSVASIENGIPNLEEAHNYLSCTGPDPEGRYEVRMEYKMANDDGTFVTAKNMTWYSEHGSYYAEDIYGTDGRINSRRSGVMTPLRTTDSRQGD